MSKEINQQWHDEAENRYPIQAGEPCDGHWEEDINIAERYAFLKGCEFEYGLDKWINVKDGLPKEGELVLIHRQYGDYVLAYISGKLWTNAVLRCRMFTEPTHWQPLPQPPKTKI